uniref:CBF1-interacting co-repressor CIR N-terminal domain-containing protein n=1 Tax=Rhizophora mucronata TaxID=61149 RepID=A0A2P2IL46_RHIMU
MGGHGGLNILPQKRWNVYNYENREKVRRDEEAAAKEEQLKQEQARKRDAEFRLERLRAVRGLAPARKSPEPAESESKGNANSNHINLFEGIKIFDPIKGLENGRRAEEEKVEGNQRKKMKVKKEEARVVTAEDEKYRLGYGVAGRGIKLPWYLERRRNDDSYVNEERGEKEGLLRGKKEEEGKKIGKKSLEEMRGERLKREKKEKERERALLGAKSRIDGGFSRRR